MKTVTKLRRLMNDNKLCLTIDGPNIEIIITNKESGNSHMVSAKNWTEVMKLAEKDTIIHSPTSDFKF